MRLRITAVMAVLLVLFVCAGFGEETVTRGVSYTFAIDDTHPIASPEKWIGTAESFIKTLAALGMNEREVEFTVCSASDPENYVTFTGKEAADCSLILSGILKTDNFDLNDEISAAQAFKELDCGDSVKVWIVTPVDLAYIEDECYRAEVRIERPAASKQADGLTKKADTPKARQEYENSVRLLETAISETEKLLDTVELNAGSDVLMAALDVYALKPDECIVYVTRDSVETELSHGEWLMLDSEWFEGSRYLADGVYYMLAETLKCDCDAALTVYDKYYVTLEEPENCEYRLNDTLTVKAEVCVYDNAARGGIGVNADEWAFTAHIKNGAEPEETLTDLNKGTGSVVLDKYNGYTLYVSAKNTITGEALKSEKVEFTVVNAAPEFADTEKPARFEESVTGLETEYENVIELADFYTDENPGTLVYSVGNADEFTEVNGSKLTFKASGLTQDREYVIDVEDEAGGHNTAGRLVVTRVPLKDSVTVAVSGDIPEKLTWSEHTVTLSASLELTDMGVQLGGRIEPGSWTVSARIAYGDGCELTQVMEYDGENYVCEYSLPEYAEYTLTVSAAHSALPGENITSEPVKTQVVNEDLSFTGDKVILTVYGAETGVNGEAVRTVDLKELYSDPKYTSDKLTYECEPACDAVSIENGVLTVDTGKITGNQEITIVVSDPEGGEIREGSVKLNYLTAKEAAEIKNANAVYNGEAHTVTVSGAIELTRDGEERGCINGDNWVVTAYIGEETYNMSYESGVWTCVYDITETGAFDMTKQIYITATVSDTVSDTVSGNIIESENIQTVCLNKAPERNRVGSDGVITTIKVAELNIKDAEYAVDLTGYFRDDFDKTLTYELAEECAFAEISDGKLKVDRTRVTDSAALKVQAVDSYGAKSEPAAVNVAWYPASDVAYIVLNDIENDTEFDYDDKDITLECFIRLTDAGSNLGCEYVFSDWSMTYALVAPDGNVGEDVAMSTSQSGSIKKFTGSTGESINIDGKWQICLKAENAATGAVLTKDVSIFVRNEAPQPEKWESDSIITTLYAADLDWDALEELTLGDRFDDAITQDADLKFELNYNGEYENSVRLDGGILKVYINRITAETYIPISATDGSQSTNDMGSVRVIYYDFGRDYMPDSVQITFNADTYTRADTVNAEIVCEIPGTAATEAEKTTYSAYLDTVKLKYELFYDGSDEAVWYCECGASDAEVQRISIPLAENGIAKVGGYTLKLTLSAGRSQTVYASAEARFALENKEPVFAGTAGDSRQAYMGSEFEFGSKLELEPNESVTLTADIEKTDFILNLLFGSEPQLAFYCSGDAYIISDTVCTDGEKLAQISDLNSENIPELRVMLSAHGSYRLKFTATDNDGKTAEYAFTVRTLAANELIIEYAIGAALALIAAFIAFIVIKRLCKPSFSGDDILKISFGKHCADIALKTWKKDPVTLRELLVYSGLPVISDFSLKECARVRFMPDRKHGYRVDPGSTEIRVELGNSEQTKPFGMSRGSTVSIKLSKAETITVTGN